jgi:hypothetical protein
VRTASDKAVEKIKTPLCLFYLNYAIYDIMWKNMVEPDRPQMAM